MDNATNHAYGAWPDRMYVIGTDGKITYGGEPGPWGFDVVVWEAAIKDALKGTPAPRDGEGPNR